MTVAPPLDPTASAAVRTFERHYRQLAFQRWLYSILGVGFIVVGLAAALWFANESNAGKFWDRLPHVFDFVSWLWPEDWRDVWRALLDLPSPNSDGTFATDYPEYRVYITEGFYVPEYIYKMSETINVAILSTLIGGAVAFVLCFLAARNTTTNGWLRFVVRRYLEILRALPEIVVAGLFAAILGLGAIPAVIAVATHTAGALGKLFFEVLENADARAEEGLMAVGAGWLQRLRYGYVPQVLPNFLSYALLRMEVNVRISTILGAVGGGGIGEQLRLSISNSWGPKAMAMILLLFVTIVAIDQLSAWLRRRLVGSQAFGVPV